jgi:SAM-dependent methyltransferase
MDDRKRVKKSLRSQYQDYRQSHTAPGYGARYNNTYRDGYYAAQWELIEKPLLREIIAGIGVRIDSCLDFACGTCRILKVLAEFSPHVTGVDISAEMLKEANIPGNVELLEHDLTVKGLGRKFDLATAFRFFLNAEDELNRAALSAIREHLHEGATLICNIHMASSSPMGLFYRTARKIFGRTIHNVADRRDFERLLMESGFEVQQVVHYSYLPRPGHYFPRLCERLILPFERFARISKFPLGTAQSFLVVARKKEGGSN